MVFHGAIFPFYTLPTTAPHMDLFADIVIPLPYTDSGVDTIPPQPIPVVDSQPVVPSLRRSTRNHRPPSHLNDFVCHNVSPYPITDYISYDWLSPSYKAFIMQVSAAFEPQFYHQGAPIPE